MDLKMLIERDFGYHIKDQQLYFNFQLIEDNNTALEVLLRDTDITTRSYLTLIFIPKNPPATKVGKIRRLKISNMALHEMFPVGGVFCKTNEEFLNIDVSKGLIYPPARDWNSEYYTIR